MRKILKYLKNTLKDGRMNFFFFLLIVFALPISRQLFTIALWPWIFTWIIEGNFKNKFSNANLRQNTFTLSFLPSLYLLMIISILWSDDKSNGFNQLGIQASMIIFPVILSFSNGLYKQKDTFRKIFISFCSGIILITIFLLIKAIIYAVTIKNGQFNFNPIINNRENVFFSSRFSFFIHPTYMGLMVLFAASICIVDIKTNVIVNKKVILKILATLYLYIIIFLISSRSIIIASVMISFFLLIILIRDIKIKAIAFLILSLAIVILLKFNPRISHLISRIEENKNKSVEKIDARFQIWESSLNLIKDHPISGVGTGNVKNKLKYIYDTKGYSFTTNYNCHNQYLEQWLSSGIISIILLISGLIIPILSKNKILPNIYYSSFLIITGFAFFFESILCRVWGIAFFSIFYTLLTRRKPETQN